MALRGNPLDPNPKERAIASQDRVEQLDLGSRETALCRTTQVRRAYRVGVKRQTRIDYTPKSSRASETISPTQHAEHTREKVVPRWGESGTHAKKSLNGRLGAALRGKPVAECARWWVRRMRDARLSFRFPHGEESEPAGGRGKCL